MRRRAQTMRVGAAILVLARASVSQSLAGADASRTRIDCVMRRCRGAGHWEAVVVACVFVRSLLLSEQLEASLEGSDECPSRSAMPDAASPIESTVAPAVSNHLRLATAFHSPPLSTSPRPFHKLHPSPLAVALTEHGRR